MPFMDGYEATTQIREYLLRHKLMQPQIVAITGHSEQAYIQRALNSGMNKVLSKPIDAQ